MKIIGLMLLIISFAIPLKAADFRMITDLGSSARTIGIANIEGFNDSSAGVFENPAGLYRLRGASLSFFTATLIQEVNYINMSVGLPTEYGTFGLGFMTARVSDIPFTGLDSLGRVIVLDTFLYRNEFYKLSYENLAMENLHLGASLTLASISAEPFLRGNGMNVDLGLLYKMNNTHISFVGKNVLRDSKVNYSNGAAETFPLEALLGVSHSIGAYDLFGQLKQAGENSPILTAVAFRYDLNNQGLITFSLGFKEFLVIGKKQNNFSVGASLDLSGIVMDYSFETSDHFQFNGNHYFSVTINLSDDTADKITRNPNNKYWYPMESPTTL